MVFTFQCIKRQVTLQATCYSRPFCRTQRWLCLHGRLFHLGYNQPYGVTLNEREIKISWFPIIMFWKAVADPKGAQQRPLTFYRLCCCCCFYPILYQNTSEISSDTCSTREHKNIRPWKERYKQMWELQIMNTEENTTTESKLHYLFMNRCIFSILCSQHRKYIVKSYRSGEKKINLHKSLMNSVFTSSHTEVLR